MDAFFESPKHTSTSSSSNNNNNQMIKTEYADFSDLISSQSQLKLVTVQPSSTSSTVNINDNSPTTTTTSSSLIQLNSGPGPGGQSNGNNTLVSVLNIDTSSIVQNDLENSINSIKECTSPNLSLSLNNVSTHTFRKTEWDVKKLENYVRNAYCDHTPMEDMAPAQLNRYLKSFFELAKKSDGMDYEPESLIGFMNSFERYLKTKNYTESLLRSDSFKEARTVLKKKRDLVRSIGKLIRTKTKDTCYLLQFHRNLLKEKDLLSRNNPDCLLAEIYLNNMIYFGEYLKEDKAWRGNLNLVWGDMLLERDPQNGLEYLTLATYAKKSSRHQQFQTGVVKMNSRSKTGTQASKLKAASLNAIQALSTSSTNTLANQQSESPHTTPRVYAQRQPLNWCPIEAYKIYRSRRPNNCLDRDSPFYLAPLFKSKNQSKVWYKALAMSCQRLDALFYCLFKKAGVDLASLANMSQQQQANAAAAAASGSTVGLLTSANNLLNPENWIIKNSPSDNEDEENEHKLLNGYHHHNQESPSNTTNTASSSNTYQFQQHHTIVPAQVQVQVQVQVPIPTTQQVNIDTTTPAVDSSSSTTTTTSQSRLYLISPSTTQSNTNTSFTMMDTTNCV